MNDMENIQQNKCMLDVILMTYNQSKYIEESLASILMQKTQFIYRVIVADDASKDDTVAKISAMAKGSKVEFLYLPKKPNMGISLNYKRAFAACSAPYVAVMEGDDIWTDPLRLQRHVDFLEEHLECPMSFNRFIAANYGRGEMTECPLFTAENGQPFRYIFGVELAEDNYIGNYSACVYRLSAIRNLPDDLTDMKGFDWLTNLCVLRQGPAGYLTRTMSIYRLHKSGTWSSMEQKDKILDLLQVIDDYDPYLGYVYNPGFIRYRERLEATLDAMKRSEIIDPSRPGRKKRPFGFFVHKAYSYIPPILKWVIKAIISPELIADSKKLVKRAIHRK